MTLSGDSSTQNLSELFYEFVSHVHMSEERYPNMLSYGQIEGTRPRGTPKKKWIDNTQEDCSAMDLTVVEANRLARDKQMENCYTELGCQCTSTTSSSPGH